MHLQDPSLQPLQGPAPQNASHYSVARGITMSSLEIAELTGKLHKNVIRDIREVLDALKQDGSDVSHVQEDKDGRGYTSCFHLDREITETLLTGYSIPLRHRVIRRLTQLEQAAAKPAFDMASLNDPKVLLALLTDNVRKVVALEADNTELSLENQALEQKVCADAPKVEFFDAVTVTHETYSVAEAAKLIGTGQNRLMAFLRQRRWVTIRKNEPMQTPIERGYLTAKLSTYEHPENGRTTVATARVTGKGLTKLRALWANRDADLIGGDA